MATWQCFSIFFHVFPGFLWNYPMFFLQCCGIFLFFYNMPSSCRCHEVVHASHHGRGLQTRGASSVAAGGSVALCCGRGTQCLVLVVSYDMVPLNDDDDDDDIWWWWWWWWWWWGVLLLLLFFLLLLIIPHYYLAMTWGFPYMEDPQSGWLRENPNLKWMRTGGTPISTSICFDVLIFFFDSCYHWKNDGRMIIKHDCDYWYDIIIILIIMVTVSYRPTLHLSHQLRLRDA